MIASFLYYLALYTPFQAVYQTPAYILVQMDSRASLPSRVEVQLAWIVVLALLCSPIVQRILKFYNVQGA